MKERVLKSKVMQTDDTPVEVLDLNLPRTRLGRIWTYAGDEHHPYTVYGDRPNRSQDGPQAFNGVAKPASSDEGCISAGTRP